MNTKLIMSLCAVSLAAAGLSLSFLPEEISAALGMDATKLVQLTFQLLGALYFGFALLNWMAKGSTIGGIYNRPMALANLAHFLAGALALVKAVWSDPELPYAAWILAGWYTLFAVLFALVVFRNPVNENKFTATAVHATAE
jgi:hypothetical protein